MIKEPTETPEVRTKREHFQQISARLEELQAESEGLAGEIEKAARGGDRERFTELLMRERALPGELAAARHEALQTEYDYTEAALWEVEDSRPQAAQAAEEARYKLTEAKKERQRVGSHYAMAGVSESERQKALKAYEEAVAEEEARRGEGEALDRRGRQLTTRKKGLEEELSRG